MSNVICQVAMLIACLVLASPSSAERFDPTRPDPGLGAPAGATSEPSHFRLDSVIYSSRRKLAVINGARLNVGDRVGQAQVVAIREGAVDLELEGKRVTLRQGEKRIKESS